MARFTQPTKQQERGWRKWVKSRPPVVRAMAERFEPWSLYRMKSTGQRVTMCSFSEDGTLTVAVTGQFNHVMFDRQVFGVSPDDLEPCDLPVDEMTGTVLTNDEVEANIDVMRVMVRPDLWTLDVNGKAVRKN
jgi:hypothetical protein